jgi:predicted transcriptional regulator
MALVTKKNKESGVAPKERTYKPTKAELAAIREGEAAAARGEFLTLDEFIHEMDRNRRRTGAKAARKVSR